MATKKLVLVYGSNSLAAMIADAGSEAVRNGPEVYATIATGTPAAELFDHLVGLPLKVYGFSADGTEIAAVLHHDDGLLVVNLDDLVCDDPDPVIIQVPRNG